jgi:hypothetical protein
MKRWMTGAVTLVAAVAGLAGAGPAAASSGGWYQTYQVNREGSFSEIAAISKTNVWAVGDLWDKNINPIYQPFIRHFDGSSWSTVTIPGSPKFDSYQVSASSADNVWVVGLLPNPIEHSTAYRWDGSHWHRIPVPAETALQGVVAFGPDNVWAYGTSGTIFAGHVGATVFHWNGSRWRGYAPDNGQLIVESMSASGPDNVWFAGFYYVHHTVAHALAYRWTGTGWHNAGLPRVLTDQPGVTAFSPVNVWLGWGNESGVGWSALHWNGRSWQAQPIPDDVSANPANVVPDGQGGYWFGDQAILTGSTWTTEPPIDVGGGYGPLVRIPGTESFLQPATVRNTGSAIQKPTIYRFDL